MNRIAVALPNLDTLFYMGFFQSVGQLLNLPAARQAQRPQSIITLLELLTGVACNPEAAEHGQAVARMPFVGSVSVAQNLTSNKSPIFETLLYSIQTSSN